MGYVLEIHPSKEARLRPWSNRGLSCSETSSFSFDVGFGSPNEKASLSKRGSPRGEPWASCSLNPLLPMVFLGLIGTTQDPTFLEKTKPTLLLRDMARDKLGFNVLAGPPRKEEGLLVSNLAHLVFGPSCPLLETPPLQKKLLSSQP